MMAGLFQGPWGESRLGVTSGLGGTWPGAHPSVDLGSQGPNLDPSPHREQRASGPACPEAPYPAPERSPFMVPAAEACLPTNGESCQNKNLRKWGERPGSPGCTPSCVTVRLSSRSPCPEPAVGPMGPGTQDRNAGSCWCHLIIFSAPPLPCPPRRELVSLGGHASRRPCPLPSGGIRHTGPIGLQPSLGSGRQGVRGVCGGLGGQGWKKEASEERLGKGPAGGEGILETK